MADMQNYTVTVGYATSSVSDIPRTCGSRSVSLPQNTENAIINFENKILPLLQLSLHDKTPKRSDFKSEKKGY